MTTFIIVTPLTYASADGELMITGDAGVVAAADDAAGRGGVGAADDGDATEVGSCAVASVSPPAAQASSSASVETRPAPFISAPMPRQEWPR